ncbi:AAA family ATPase [Clostridium estertheticum]|uniref:ATP-dependent nuclease n=1 Tax=Clostridium estertheticum TaxID=238834 RepID=UPI001C0E1953|nr:AAA family ATPase [Clostridium estertheticum]MBU3199494.1 AAA family ATPase [Clostridium estertheticum]WAG65428.1 AAA family ATPase [Clostridium estertheticum]
MFISKIYVRNFRKFDDEGTTFIFQKGINVILGENNGGKSSLIDVIRLALASGKYKKNLYTNVSDFHINDFGDRASEIVIDICFEDLLDEQGVAFYPLTDGTDTSKAELHINYKIYKDTKGNEKVRDYIYGGRRDNNIDKEVFDNINLIFMAALRNAENDLKPSRSSQLASLLFASAPLDEDKQRLTSAFISANESVKSDQAISVLQSTINNNLNLIEKEELHQKVTINLLPPTFEGIAGSLDAWYSVEHKSIKVLKVEFETLKTAFNVLDSQLEGLISDLDDENVIINIEKMEKNSTLSELYTELIKNRKISDLALKQNGLGYNNILSMATSLGDIQKQPITEELSIFLIEEPEAHLHPQLLDLLFNFFKKSNSESKIQIFITSHSPTLIAKADIDSLSIMHEFQSKVFCSSLACLTMSLTEKEDLKRYLDVTKSQLFFAKRVLFVEGISEAMLFLEFANLLNKPFDKYSVEVVNIDGVAFAPFAKLFVEDGSNNNLKFLCAIVSDNDKCTNKNDAYIIKSDELTYFSADIESIKNKLKNGTNSYRAQNLLNFKTQNISVELANKTLEYELALIKENNFLLLEILEPLHPKICADIRGKIFLGEPQENIAIRIWLAIRDCKGVFAQRLAREINKIYLGTRTDVTFIVPQYTKRAIDFIIN